MARTRYNDLKLSAEFKRDYVQVLALFAFFFILAGEVALAISIPWYLGRENAMADEVTRLELRAEFDGLRNGLNGRIKNSRNDLYTAELKVAKWDADKMADFLRDNLKKLSKEDVAEMRQRVREMSKVTTPPPGRGSVSQENVLNTTRYMDSVIPKKEAKHGK